MKNGFLILSIAVLCSMPAFTGGRQQSAGSTGGPELFKIACESYTVTMDAGEMPMFKDIEKALNVKFEFEQVRSGWAERKAIILASGDLPDIFLGGLTDGDILINKDYFVDMRKYLDLAPNIKKMLQNPSVAATAAFPDGAVYSLPLVLGFMPKSWLVMMINKTWLDKLGLKVPTTFDELEQAMIAFRDKDPNGNGIKDELPMDWPIDPNGFYAHSMFCLTGAYGVTSSSALNDDLIVINNGKVDFLYTSQAYYKLIQKFNKWYSMGLINPEVFTNTYEQASALSTQGDVARIGITAGWSVPSRTGKFASQYIDMDQLRAEPGSTNKLVWISNPGVLRYQANKCEITTKCKKPELAMKIVDMFYSDDFTVQSYYGSFPDNVTKYADGTYSINTPADGVTVEENKWKKALVNYGPGYFSDELEARVKVPPELLARLEEDKIYQDNMVSGKDIMPAVKYNDEDSQELVFLRSDIQKLVKQKTVQWVVSGGIENEWDAYLSDLNRMGLEKMRVIFQKGYNTVYK
jgi:putative aldouronate transport system substrate-binding protein